MDAVTYEDEQGARTQCTGDEERRIRPRVLVSVPFRLHNGEGQLLLHARTLDLSTHGALLHGSYPLSVGDEVRLELLRGEARNPLKLNATVVRFTEPAEHRRHHGIAVRFQGITSLDEAILKSLIAGSRV